MQDYEHVFISQGFQMALYDFEHVYLTLFLITHAGITFIYLKVRSPQSISPDNPIIKPKQSP